MEDPSDGFCEAIRGVDNARDADQLQVAGLFPVLDGEVLGVDVARARSRFTGVDHLDRRLIVFENRSGFDLGKTKLTKNGTKALGNLGSFNSSKKLSLGAGASASICAWQRQATTPEARQKPHPAAELRLQRSLAREASTKPQS